jgi:hypothetical protein
MTKLTLAYALYHSFSQSLSKDKEIREEWGKRAGKMREGYMNVPFHTRLLFR